MSETNILLEKNRSKESSNITENVSVNLENKVRLLESDKLQDNLSLYGLYNKERDECEKYRLIFTINPVCSNVLFNIKTELVQYEGADYCSVISSNAFFINKPASAINTTSKIKHLQAIRDTEYSHPDFGNVVYHCGLDIFNNHMIRNNNFTHVSVYNASDPIRGSVFNTFMDYLADKDGKVIRENIYEYGDDKKVARHLYTADSLLSFKDAFLNRCEEENGWFGFINPSNINIENAKDSKNKKITINRALMNNKACEFIDLYPDRSLFSFIPKYNKYRAREEKNWDYVIVYPYASDENKLNEVCGGESGAIAFKYKRVKGKNKDLLECFSYFKHNLRVGSYVRIYYKAHNEEFKSYTKVRVESVGDRQGKNKDRVFNIDYNSLKGLYNKATLLLFYKRLSNDTECSYYFRKFKPIDADQKLTSEINKIAFGRNIYGDELAQIVYTDDINLSNLVDNNGRPVSELYLTIVKRNSGYNAWYKNNNFSGSNIEFSHCFGKVSSGLDFSGMGVEREPVNYNIHYINNVKSQFNEGQQSSITASTSGNYLKIKNTWNGLGESITLKNPKALEDNITASPTFEKPNGTNEFYGDIVEFDPYYYREFVIGNVYHRFNTAQRETFNTEYRDILEDIILRDDFDVVKDNETSGFATATYYLNSMTTATHKYGSSESKNDLFYGNVFPEGYYYNPFYKIKVREEEESQDSVIAKKILYNDVYCDDETDNEIKELKVLSNKINRYTKIGQTVALYDNVTKGTAIGYINDVNTIDGILSIQYFSEDIKRASRLQVLDSTFYSTGFSENGRYELYWSEAITPRYARVCRKTGEIVWRELVSPSKLNNTSELYDTPFMNGRFYKNVNVNFFLRRQDPFGDYGLSVPIGSTSMNQISTFILNSKVKKFDTTSVEIALNNNDLCY